MKSKSIQLQGPRQTQGTIQLPGSKSISNRVLLLAALAQGTTRIENLLFSDDTHWMLSALTALGIHVQQHADYIEVQGAGGLFNTANTETLSLFLGNAGTAMRPLCAALAASTGQFELTGEPRMKERPIGPLVDALISLGADIQYGEQLGFPPLLINGSRLQADKISIDGSLSSQYISAVLMILPLIAGEEEGSETELTLTGSLVSLPYIELTVAIRSEEHTSELQSRPHLVCRLLLEKKKKKKKNITIISQKKIKHLHPSTAILLVCCEHRFIQQQYCSDSLDHDTHINYIT